MSDIKKVVDDLVNDLLNQEEEYSDVSVSLVSNPITSIGVVPVFVNEYNFIYNFYDKFERDNDDSRVFKKVWNDELKKFVLSEDQFEISRYNNIKFVSKPSVYFDKFKNVTTVLEKNNFDISSTPIGDINNISVGDYYIKSRFQNNTDFKFVYEYDDNVKSGDIFSYLDDMVGLSDLNLDISFKYDFNSDINNLFFSGYGGNIVISDFIRYICFKNELLCDSGNNARFYEFFTTFLKKFNDVTYAIASKNINTSGLSGELADKVKYDKYRFDMSSLPASIETVGNVDFVNSNVSVDSYGEVIVYYVGNMIRRKFKDQDVNDNNKGELIDVIFGDVDNNVISHKQTYDDIYIKYGFNYEYSVSPLLEMHQETISDNDGTLKIIKN